MKNIQLYSLTLLAVAISGHVGAETIKVDGDLSDWGIDKTNWVTTKTGIYSYIEDSTGSGSYRLYPGWGGQAYDAEALYATIADNKLYIALATGHNPRTLNKPDSNSYGAGDFAIDFGKDGSYELGVNIKHATNKLSDGNYTFEDFGEEGGVYKNPKWAYGLWNANGNYDPGNPDIKHPTSLIAGKYIDAAKLSYTTQGVSGYGHNRNDLHYFYEMSIDLEILRLAGWNGSAFDIQWTELCANDIIVVDPGQSVPEPSSLALLGAGLFGLIGFRRRVRNE